MASPVLKDRLISLVIKWPTLWDRNSLSYSEPSWKKAKAWEVIAKELNMEGQAGKYFFLNHIIPGCMNAVAPWTVPQE